MHWFINREPRNDVNIHKVICYFPSLLGRWRNFNFSTQSYMFLRTKICFLKANFTSRNLCLYSWQTLNRVTITCSLQWSQLLGACQIPSLSTQHQFFSRRQLSCVVFGIFVSISRAHKKPARNFIFLFLSASKYLNTLAMGIMYHQKSFLYGLTRPSLGQCDFMRRLKLFLKKIFSCSSLLTELLEVIIMKRSYCYWLTMTVPTAASRPLTPPIIEPLASSTQTMIILTAGLSVRPKSVEPSQFITTTTTT